MIIHVLPGDSLAPEFAAAGIEGDVVVFREALIDGDLSGETLDEFWDRRANFLALHYGGDPIEYQEGVAYEVERLLDLPRGSEVNLWFEHELFCQVNMWFCLSLLRGSENKIFRVMPTGLLPDQTWAGFAGHTADDLATAFSSRTQFTEADIETAAELFAAFGARDAERLRELREYRSPCFPFLKEVCTAAAVIETKPAEILEQIRRSGVTEFDAVFAAFRERAGVYGFGDSQVERLLNSPDRSQ